MVGADGAAGAVPRAARARRWVHRVELESLLRSGGPAVTQELTPEQLERLSALDAAHRIAIDDEYLPPLRTVEPE